MMHDNGSMCPHCWFSLMWEWGRAKSFDVVVGSTPPPPSHTLSICLAAPSAWGEHCYSNTHACTCTCAITFIHHMYCTCTTFHCIIGFYSEARWLSVHGRVPRHPSPPLWGGTGVGELNRKIFIYAFGGWLVDVYTLAHVPCSTLLCTQLFSVALWNVEELRMGLLVLTNTMLQVVCG